MGEIDKQIVTEIPKQISFPSSCSFPPFHFSSSLNIKKQKNVDGKIFYNDKHPDILYPKEIYVTQNLSYNKASLWYTQTKTLLTGIDDWRQVMAKDRSV